MSIRPAGGALLDALLSNLRCRPIHLKEDTMGDINDLPIDVVARILTDMAVTQQLREGEASDEAPDEVAENV